MKKIFLVMSLVLGLAVFASAQTVGYKGAFAACAPDASLVTLQQAQANVQAIINASHPGFKIKDIEARDANEGGGFKAEAEKSMSRDLEFYVSPCGIVNGPYKD